MRLRTQVLLLQLAVIALSLGAGFGLVIAGADDRVRDEYAQRALAIAQSVASAPGVRQAVAAQAGTTLDPATLAAGVLQAEANAVARRTGALFVVIGNRDGIRLAHPEDEELGKHVSTDPTRVLAGQVDVTTDRGTLGESVRAKVPVFGGIGSSGPVVGFVSVGVSTQKLADDTRRDMIATALIGAAALGVGAVGSVLLARRWRRLTLGLEPDELTELVREQRAVLHSMADGVVAVDPDGTMRIINDHARTLLDIDAPIGTHIDDIGLTPRIADVLAVPTANPVAATVDDRVVLVSSHRVAADGRDLGMVLQVIDRTDVERLTREVDSIRTMSSALRAQRHETANRFHVLGGLLRHGHSDAALAYLDELTGANGAESSLAGLENIAEPHLHAFLDAKSSLARERAVTLRLGSQTWVTGTLLDPVVATTVIGNLVDNAIDAASVPGEGGTVEVELLSDGDTLFVTVADSGPGIVFDDPDRIFADGETTKVDAAVPGGRGLGLAIARRIARRIGGDITIGDPGRNPQPDNELGGAILIARLPGILSPETDTDGAGG